MKYGKTLAGIAALTGLMAVSTVATAQETIGPGDNSAWTFYGYGNAYVMAEILEAIKRLVSMEGFQTLATILAMVGFLGMAWSGLMGRKPERIGAYGGGLMLALYLLFTLKLDVYVQDMVWSPTGGPQYTEVVQDIPAAIGLPAVVISEIGMWTTQSIEQQFTTPQFNSLMMSEGAPFGLSMGVVNDMDEIKLTKPTLRSSIQAFIYDCVIPEISTGGIDAQDIVKSPDVWSEMSNVSPARYTEVVNNSGTAIKQCDSAYDDLDTRLQNYAPQLTRGIQDASPFWFQQAVGDTTLSEAALEDAFAWASDGNVTQDATGLATQAAVVDLYSGAYEYGAMATESSEMMLALNLDQAKRAQTTGWHTASQLFQDMAGYFFAILQAFLIAVAPLIVLALLIPGMGMKIGGAYARVLVWLVLWWPGLAIINYIMHLYMQDQARAYLTAGYSMDSIYAVSQVADNMVMAAGFMATLVPAVMWSLVSATGMAFTSVLDRASGANFANDAASSAAAGSFSAGQVSMNSTNMNKHDTSQLYTTGFQGSEHHIGAGAGVSNYRMGGQETRVGNQAQTETTSLGTSVNSEMAAAKTEEAKQQFTSTVSSEVKEQAQELDQLMQERGYTENGEYNWEKATQDSDVRNSVDAIAALDKQLEQEGITEEQRSEIYASAGIGLGGSAGAGSGNLGAGGSTKNSTTKSQTEQSSQETSSSTEVKDAIEAREAHSENWKGGESFREGETESTLQSHLDAHSYSEIQAAQESYSEAKQVQERASQAEQASENAVVVAGMHPDQRDEILAQAEERNQAVNEEIAQLDFDVGAEGVEQRAEVQGENINMENGLANDETTLDVKTADVRENVESGVEENQNKANSEELQNDMDRQALRQTDQANEKALANGNYDDVKGFESNGQTYQPVGYYQDPESRDTSVVYGAEDGSMVRNAGDGEVATVSQNDDNFVSGFAGSELAFYQRGPTP